MNWEVTISEYSTNNHKIYKVTKRIPLIGISETQTFKSKEKATKQFKEWLNTH